MLGTEEIIWNLNDLYSGVEAPEITRDMEFCYEEAASITAAFAGKVNTLDGQALASLVDQLEQLDTLLARLSTFAFLNFTTQTHDAIASALLQQVEELAATVGRATVFFRLEWNKLSAEQAETLLADPAVSTYRHYLETLRHFAPYQLSSQQEEILQELGPVGRSAWNVLFEKLLGKIEFGKTSKSEEEVLSELYSGERECREQAAVDLTAGLEENEHILTHIFNTLAAEKMISDRLRGFDTWVSQMNLENQLEDTTVDTLIEAVTSRYTVVQRYYLRKADILGYKTLFDYDRYAPIPTGETSTRELIPWEKCREIVLQAFSGFSPLMGEIAERFFAEEWIHAPVLKRKRGGAFAHPCTPDVHPYIMVNYTGHMRDVSTVAHELGHGVHQFLAAKQGYYNSDTPLVLAETASVFAELLVFQDQLALLDDPMDRQSFICQKLESTFATVFRQVAMNRFEEAMHNGRRELGELSKEQLSAYWLASQKEMFGDSVTLTENYGIWWSYIPHFLGTPGYVYSYAFGELLVLSLYSRYLEEGESFVGKYLDLLAAGGGASPYVLLQPFGIDLNDANFWHGGLQIIETMLEEVEEPPYLL